MAGFEVVDTFPAFLAYREKFQELPLDAQIEGWATKYMSPWPELLARQVEDYSSQGLNWREVAREKGFPNLAGWLPAMQEARRNLLELIEPIHRRAQGKFGFEARAVFVIYVGIGCGAGWVTEFWGMPAILFGLESIAENGWSEAAAIAGLIAHEIAHLAHHQWREQNGKPMGSGPWWQLYEEGFAHFCERLLSGLDSWHQERGDSNWLDGCREHRNWLAAEFLQRVDAGKSVADLFGSWFEIGGKKETGYYLGGEAIGKLAEKLGLKEIALLDDPEVCLRPVLEEMAGSQSLSIFQRDN